VIKDTPEDLPPAAKKLLSEQFDKKLHTYIKNFPFFHPEDSLLDFRVGDPCPAYGLDVIKVYQLENKNNFEEALEFRAWNIPIYLGDEKEPRTLFRVRKESDGKWHYMGMGGRAQPLAEARENWPAEEGYKSAYLVTHPFRTLIMLEKADTLQIYIFSQDSVVAKFFGVSKNSDGFYPLFSRDHLIEHIKSKEKYSRKRTGLD